MSKTLKSESIYLIILLINLKELFLHKSCLPSLKRKPMKWLKMVIHLNVDVFNQIYERLFREYNGDEMVFDDEVKYGWSRIPHFYRPFYVYKYATGYASAIHLATKILAGDQETLKSYLEFLQSGSSDYPLELLKKTGVDLTTPYPIINSLNRFEELVVEFSKL